MNERSFEEKAPGTEAAEKESVEHVPENNYERYKSLGGIINENDYRSALDRAGEATALTRQHIAQAEVMAKVAGITLHSTKGFLDPKVALYGVLRSDRNPREKYHHSQMSDQRLFAEALRMLGDDDSLRKLIATHPNISF